MLCDDAVKGSLMEIERRKRSIALAIGLRGVRRSVRTGKRKYGTPNKGGGKSELQISSLRWENKRKRQFPS